MQLWARGDVPWALFSCFLLCHTRADAEESGKVIHQSQALWMAGLTRAHVANSRQIDSDMGAGEGSQQLGRREDRR